MHTNIPAFAPSATLVANAPSAQPAGPFERAERPTPSSSPAGYNPKPGQQPDPRNPDQAPGPDIERPNAPSENPGVSPAPHVDPASPSPVPDPPAPYVEPARPEFQPIGPNYPEIQQPEPMTHPGMQKAVAEPVAEKSFFDEI